jgi:ectoine hydroxylase-related dioxygenase (phytanoyl-CoA dioxygenase family)
MNVALQNLVPATSEPRTHNHLIGNLPALQEAMDRDGYWFFRDVLDEDAVTRLRRIYTDELERVGVIDPVGNSSTAASVRPNGRTTDVDINAISGMPFARASVWRSFVEDRPIHDFLVKLLGEEPFWKPSAVYRTTPPNPDGTANRITGYHQDGPSNPGIEFITMWVPLAEIDWEVGGIIFAEGLTDHVNRHRIDEHGSNKGIAPENLPSDSLRHTTYRPGDVLFMNCWTPHSGLTNVSDRFRLSLDQRIVRPGTRRPYVGEVLSIAPDRIEVRDDSGITRSIRIVESSYTRATANDVLRGQALVDALPPGTRVIVGHDNGVVTLLRKTHQE